MKRVFTWALITGILSSLTITLVGLPAQASDCTPGPSKYLQNCDFSYDGENWDFTDANLDGATFRASHMYNANFRGASLKGASFFGSRCLGCDFSNADLEGATLDASNLLQINIEGANLAGISVVSYSVPNSSIGPTIGTPLNLPEGYYLVQGETSAAGLNGFPQTSNWLLGPNIAVNNINFTNVNLDSLDLSGIKLQCVNFIRSSLNGTDFSNAKISAAFIESSLKGANFRGANFGGGSCGSTSFSSSTLDYSDFRDTRVTAWLCFTLCDGFGGVSSVKMLRSGGMQLGENWRDFIRQRNGIPWGFASGYLLAPGVDLEGADLSHANIYNIDLSGAKLTNVNLTGATLQNITFDKSVWKNVRLDQASIENQDFSTSSWSQVGGSKFEMWQRVLLPEEWSYTCGGIVGPDADLNAGNWTGCDLSNRNLESATLGGDLTNADLSYSNLKNVTIDSSLKTSNLVGTNNGYSVRVSANAVTQDFLPNGWHIECGEDHCLSGVLVSSIFTHTSMPSFGGAKVAEEIQPNCGTWDQGVSFNYRWLLDGVPIQGAHGENYTPLPAQVGHKIAIEITGSKPGFDSVTYLSQPKDVEPGDAPEVTQPSIYSAKVGVLVSYSRTSNLSEIDDGFQWLLDGVQISGATSATYLPSPTDVGHLLSLKLQVNRLGYLPRTAVSAQVKVEPGTMVSDLLQIKGTPKVGITLKAITKNWVIGTRIFYQWMIDGKSIKNATLSTYKVSTKQRGHRISVMVRQSKNGYLTASKVSTSLKIG